ncbi:uncharacterized protein LOC112092134 [Morus notabilis]|uniref:uncharacterized protein LOC112092134 n=1 Tax=Morus notabilis TaxID=981085 RepID=UPI000CED0970|nr:uncharacterized protein LOC112092134 [Morus notabilis]
MAKIDHLDRKNETRGPDEREIVERRLLLEEVLFEEAISWRQKMKTRWVKEGDANTKLFHSLVSNRKNTSVIGRIEREDGEVINDSVEVVGEIVAFYANLYKEEENTRWYFEGIYWKQSPREKAAWLERGFKEEEIKAAVFSSDKDKSSGPDGFSMGFYKKCWEFLKGDLKKLWKRQSLQASAFIRGRWILDGVLVANEIVEEYRVEGKDGLVFKVDFEKAYDHVKWNFLKVVLELRGVYDSFLLTLVVDGLSRLMQY